MQFAMGLRKDINAHVGTLLGSNGIYIENDGTGSSATPLTLPLISNAAILGPDQCGTSVSADFKYGIQFANNGAGYIKNSAIGGWPISGLYVEDALSIGNTTSTPNKLNFSYNAIIPVSTGLTFSNRTTWLGTGCNTSMSIWLNGPVTSGCEESGNDFLLTDFGYNANICSNYCEVTPDFSYSATELENTNFSAPFNNAFFTEVDYKGAIQDTDWTTGWTRVCPQQESYCSLSLRSASAILPAKSY